MDHNGISYYLISLFYKYHWSPLARKIEAEVILTHFSKREQVIWSEIIGMNVFHRLIFS